MAHILDKLEFMSADIIKDPVTHRKGFVSESIENGYRKIRNGTFDMVTQGVAAVLASGAGKGMMMFAALAISGTALVLGALSATGMPLPEGVPVGDSLGAAFKGIEIGAAMLQQPVGLLALGGAALGGGYLGYRAHKQELAKEFAHAEERQRQQALYEERAKQQAFQQELERAGITPTMQSENERSFSEKYAASQRGPRVKIQQSAVPESHTFKEMRRRAEDALFEVGSGTGTR